MGVENLESKRYTNKLGRKREAKGGEKISLCAVEREQGGSFTIFFLLAFRVLL